MARTRGAARMPAVYRPSSCHARDERRPTRIGVEPASAFGATGRQPPCRSHAARPGRGWYRGAGMSLFPHMKFYLDEIERTEPSALVLQKRGFEAFRYALKAEEM